MNKVIFVNRFFFPDDSATSRILSDLAFALPGAGVQVLIITSRLLYEGSARSLRAEEHIQSVRVRRAWSTSFGRGSLVGRLCDYLTFYLALLAALMGEVRRGDVVVAMTDPPLLSICVAMVTWLKRAKLVNWLQDVFPEVAERLDGMRRFGPMLRVLRNVSWRRAAANVSIGERMAEYLCQQGCHPDSIRTIPNWAQEAEIWPIQAQQSDLRRRLQLQEHFVVGYSGNLGRAHEFQTLVDAAVLLRQRSDLAFLIIGGGFYLAWLESQIRARQLMSFYFLPYQPKEILADALGASDVHLISLRAELEGLIVPSKFYSVAAAARPAIFCGDPRGELAQVINAENCGLVARGGHGVELAAAIERLSIDRELCRSMGERAHRVLHERFGRSKGHGAWIELLCGLLQ